MAAQAARAQAKAPPAMAQRTPAVQPAAEPLRVDAPRPLASLSAIPAAPAMVPRPPPVQPAAGPLRVHAPRPLASLSAIPATPAVQRKCSACEDEDREELPVQPRLEVGPVGDRYEQEADTIAGRVMAMRDGDVSPAAGVQRACSACSEEPPRARRLNEVEEELDQQVQPLRDGGSETIAASDGQLTSGGSSLPSETRGFFEERMGRDLGDVRVHQGSGAQALNDSISARAFTYKNHIWLGANENAGPSFTMAHELAHVMQQTAPGPVGPRRRSAASRRRARVQRVKCNDKERNLFFAPINQTQASAEHFYLSSLTGNGIFGEVPIPNAKKDGGGGCEAVGQSGRADLVRTSNGKFVGFRLMKEVGPTIPRPWYTVDPAKLNCDNFTGTRFKTSALWIHHKQRLVVDGKDKRPELSKDAAPVWNETAKSFSGEPPTSIEIGEVKFGGTPSPRAGAKKQIENYLAGIELSHAAYESMRNDIDRGSNELAAGRKPKLKEWKLKTDFLTSKIGSSNWTPLQENVDLVMARWEKLLVPRPDGSEWGAKKCDGTPTYKGKFYGGQDSAKSFVWLYAWYPDSLPPTNAKGDGAEYTGFRTTADRLMQAVTASPGEGPRPRMRPLAAERRPARRRVQRVPKPGKPIPTKDPFAEQYAKWKEDRATLAKQFGKFEKTDRYGAAVAPLLFNQALKNTKDITSQTPSSKVVPDTSPAMKTAEKGLRNLRILASPVGVVLGALRVHFGQFFLSVMKFFAGVKDKFAALFKQPAKGSSSGMAGKALHVFTKILGAVASYLLPQITDALLDCTKEGIRRTVEKWLEDTPFADLEKTLNGYMIEAERLRDKVFGEITAFVESTFGPLIAAYEAIKDKIKVVVNIIGVAKKAFNAARALACLAGGLETAGIACIVSAADALLSLIGASPTEYLLASLLGTCAAQKIFGKAILGVQKVRELPRTIAGEIVKVIRPKLPPAFQGLICEQSFFESVSADLPKLGEVTCQEETVPQGASWMIPSEIDPKLLNRPLKKGEQPLAGFDPEKAAAEIPPDEKPTPPPPKPVSGGQGGKDEGTGEAASGELSSGAASTSGGEEGGTGAAASSGNMSIVKRSLKRTDGTVGVTLFVHGIGRGFDVGKYPIPDPRNVQISLRMAEGFFRSTDVMAIKVLEVIPPAEGETRYIIHFVPQDTYVLETKKGHLEVPVGKIRIGYLGSRR